VLLLDVFDGDEDAAEVADVGEDLLLGRAEARHRLDVTRLSNALSAWSLLS